MPEVKCPNCGQEADGEFCKWCGYPIRRKVSPLHHNHDTGTEKQSRRSMKLAQKAAIEAEKQDKKAAEKALREKATREAEEALREKQKTEEIEKEKAKQLAEEARKAENDAFLARIRARLEAEEQARREAEAAKKAQREAEAAKKAEKEAAAAAKAAAKAEKEKAKREAGETRKAKEADKRTAEAAAKAEKARLKKEASEGKKVKKGKAGEKKEPVAGEGRPPAGEKVSLMQRLSRSFRRGRKRSSESDGGSRTTEPVQEIAVTPEDTPAIIPETEQAAASVSGEKEEPDMTTAERAVPAVPEGDTNHELPAIQPISVNQLSEIETYLNEIEKVHRALADEEIDTEEALRKIRNISGMLPDSNTPKTKE